MKVKEPVSLEAVHTHTHTSNLIDKIKNKYKKKIVIKA